MKERIRNNVYMTVSGLLLYLGSVWLSKSYHLPSDIAFGCFFAAYLLAGYSVFQKIAEHFLEKIFLDGNVLLVLTTIGAFGVGYYVEAVAVILIFQIGNREDMAVGTEAGDLAVNVLDEYVKDFQKRNPTLRVFSCYLHQDEATPHLHIDFVPYVTNWKGKGMDTRVSLKQALKSLGFQGGNKHDTELNQWINHEKEVLAEIAKQHGIEWEQKGTHEEHLDVYNFKKKERKKEVQELEQKKEYLTAENEGLIFQVAEARADIKLLEEEKIQFQKDKETAERRAEKAETELKKLEDRREFLQPVMDNVSKEIKEYGMIKTFLPEATALERAVSYRDKKIKPLFIEMKNKIGAMAAQVKELTRERDKWKSKFQKKKQEHENTKKELAEVQKDYQKLSGEKEILQGIADRYNRLLRMLGKDMIERLVQDDIRMQAELEAKKQKEQMPKKISDRIPWAKEQSEEYNAQIKKNKAKIGRAHV